MIFSKHISHSKKKWGRYDYKFVLVFRYNTRYSCQVLMGILFPRQISEKYSNTKCHEKASSRTKVVACGQTDRQTDRQTDGQTDMKLIIFLCSWVRASWINVNNCQQNANKNSFLISTKCSTYFESWRSQNFVPTPPQQREVTNTVRSVPDAVTTVYVCSWWWVNVSPETCL